jgi:Uma2 family endonuclease
MSEAATRHMSYTEYLANEMNSSAKHEFLRGEAFAMAGGTPEHAALAAQITYLLIQAIGDRPCRTFSSDLRVRIWETELTTYPDVTVVCGKADVDDDDPHAITNPVLVVEVLSDGTEAYDRGEKAAHYRRLASLREYLLVSQRERRLELYRRANDGQWMFLEAGPGETLELASVGVSLSTDAAYRNPLG